MANIDKELNQIKNAVYGREVRGSIHDGIDKINKETEIATGKADEAHGVMESIINDGFDNAALESNFEQKLDDKINNLQPEWTQFKEQTNQQLAQTAKRTEGIISVKEFGAVGDGVTDDTQAIKNAIEIAELTPDSTLLFPSTDGYYTVTETIYIPPEISVEMIGTVLYNGALNEPCLVIGNQTSNTSNKNYLIKVRRSELSDWTDENCKGVEFINIYTSTINIRRAERFTIGVSFKADGSGFVYNEVLLGNLRDNMLQLDLTNVNSGWVNENTIHGGRFWNSSSTHTNKSRYGVRITSEDVSYNNNSNKFYKPSFELIDPTEGEALPILIENGMYNVFEHCRNEGNSSIFARVLNESSNNDLSVSFGVIRIDDQSDNPTTTYKGLRHNVFYDSDRLLFHSGDLSEKACYYNGATSVNIAGLFTGASTNSNVNISSTSISISDDHISLAGSRCVGIRLRTDTVKRFVVRRDVLQERSGRVMVRCYDENMNVIGDSSSGFVKGLPNRSFSFYSDFGGVYRSGVTDSELFFTVDESVKYIDVLIGSSASLRSFSILTDSSLLTTPFNPLTVIKENVATTAPTEGVWKIGKKVYNVGTLEVGSPIGWVNVVDNGCDFRPFGIIA